MIKDKQLLINWTGWISILIALIAHLFTITFSNMQFNSLAEGLNYQFYSGVTFFLAFLVCVVSIIVNKSRAKKIYRKPDGFALIGLMLMLAIVFLTLP